MTRHKKRRSVRISKLFAVIVCPLVVIGTARSIPLLADIIKIADGITLNKPRSFYAQEKNPLPPECTIEFSEDYEDIINEEYILSRGYGCVEETEEVQAFSELENPLYTVSDNPGEKPYPSEEDWTEGGAVLRTTYTQFSGNSFFNLKKCGQVNNQTSVPDSELIKESGYLPDFRLTDTAEPQVLIYHTHTTESFEPYVRDFFDPNFNYRTTDPTKNVVMVGDAICRELENSGIGVIHAADIHDYPSYNGSYARSRETVSAILEQYPTIKVVLDIHRDAIMSDGCAYQPYVEIDGREAAQVMIISGCDDGTMGMPNYRKNFRFASALQQQIESDWEGLTRPILFDYRKYNQDLTTGSLLIEIGSHCNTLEQAQYSGQLVGRSLAELLNSLK